MTINTPPHYGTFKGKPARQRHPFLFVVLLLLTLNGCTSKAPGSSDSNGTSLATVVKSPPAWSRNATIYEVNLRQYSESGSFSAFTSHLPRLKEMGVKIIWLMPLHPIGVQNRKGTLGSYYSVQDYLGVNPEHGTLDDLKELVCQVHEQGMYLILDWVANHCAWDNPWVSEHPDWFTRDENGEMISPVPDWSDVVDLNYDNHDMRAAMINALRFWVVEADIDGYRCDVAGMLPLDFWRAARKELDKIKPVFLLAEGESRELHEAFDMTYTWDLHHLMTAIAAGEQDATDLKNYFSNDAHSFPRDAYRMNFTSNHDENSWNGTVFERLGESAAAFACLTAVSPGMPLLYSGQEAGLERRLAFFDRDVISWHEHPFGDLYRELFNLHLENGALANGNAGGVQVWLQSDSPEAVCAFTRERGRGKVLAIFNLSDSTRNVQIGGESLPGKYRRLFGHPTALLSLGARFKLVIPPWGYRIYVGV